MASILLQSDLFSFYDLKVPSFPDDVAMALIEEELGQPWQNIYSELSPSPIAAGTDIYVQTFTSREFSLIL